MAFFFLRLHFRGKFAIFFFWERLKFCGKFARRPFVLKNTCAFCPWSLASRGSVLGKSVLGLGFFCVLGLGLESSVLDYIFVNVIEKCKKIKQNMLVAGNVLIKNFCIISPITSMPIILNVVVINYHIHVTQLVAEPGGRNGAIAMQNTKNKAYHVFSTFETVFCSGIENIPPFWQFQC